MRRNRPLSSTEKPSKTSTTMLFTLQTVSIYRMSVINMFFERMIFSSFSAILFLIFFTTYLSHICSTCKIIIKQEACMKLPLLLIEMICPLTYKSRCFLAPRTSLKSFRCPEATTIHYTTTLLSTIGERMRRLPN